MRPGVCYQADGEARFEVRRGRYRVSATRGMEWSLAEAELAAEGRPAQLELALRREVDTTGFIACDTHVLRLSRRLQLSEHADDPVKLEFDLADIVPKKDWTLFSHLLIFHGRRICTARKPNCPECPIAEHCPAANRPDLW